MCVGSPCVGGSPHPPARIMSIQLFSPDTSIPSISNYHTPWEPIREAWGSAFRIQACLVAQLCHRSQQWLTGQSPPCHSCHCSLPGPSGPHIPPWRSLHLWLPYLHRLGTQGGGGGIAFSLQASARCSPQHIPAPLHQHPITLRKLPSGCAGLNLLSHQLPCHLAQAWPHIGAQIAPVWWVRQKGGQVGMTHLLLRKQL